MDGISVLITPSPGMLLVAVTADEVVADLVIAVGEVAAGSAIAVGGVGEVAADLATVVDGVVDEVAVIMGVVGSTTVAGDEAEDVVGVTVEDAVGERAVTRRLARQQLSRVKRSASLELRGRWVRQLGSRQKVDRIHECVVLDDLALRMLVLVTIYHTFFTIPLQYFLSP